MFTRDAAVCAIGMALSGDAALARGAVSGLAATKEVEVLAAWRATNKGGSSND